MRCLAAKMHYDFEYLDPWAASHSLSRATRLLTASWFSAVFFVPTAASMVFSFSIK